MGSVYRRNEKEERRLIMRHKRHDIINVQTLFWIVLILLFVMTVIMQGCKSATHHHHYYIIMEKASWPHREEPIEEAYTFKHDSNCSGLHITCGVYHADGESCMTCLPNLAWTVGDPSDSLTYTQPFDTLVIRDDGRIWPKNYAEEDSL
jgi:hypothetical protein